MYCGRCGNEIPEGAVFCAICGEKLVNREEVTVEKKKNNNDFLIKIISIVIVVCIIGGVIFNYYKEKNSVENRIIGHWYWYDYDVNDYSRMDYLIFYEDGTMTVGVENDNKPTDGSMSVASIEYDGNYYVEEEYVTCYTEEEEFEILFMEEYENPYLAETYYDVIIIWVDGRQATCVKPY